MMRKPIIASYGNWKSPITTETITSNMINIEHIVIDHGTIYWSESHPTENGRTALMKLTSEKQISDCLPTNFSVGSRVYEYGGGAFTVFNGNLFFVNSEDQHLYLQCAGSVPECLSQNDCYRFADLVIDCSRNRLICVREDHIKSDKVTNSIVAIPFQGGDGQVLVEGYNFFSSARISPDGTHLAWLCWNFPNMPWDGCELWVAEFKVDGSLGKRKKIAGDENESIFQPEWSPDNLLYFVSDRDGWWNLYRSKPEIEPLCPLEAEFGVAQWNLAKNTYAFLSETEILCTFNQNGIWKFARLNTQTGNLALLDNGYSDISNPHTGSGLAVFLAGSLLESTALIKFDPVTNQTETIRKTIQSEVDPAYFSSPRLLEYPDENGLNTHAIYYPATNPDYRAPEGELPILLVICHGGPTLAVTSALDYSVQFWTSRGFAVLAVNYGGSTGYGRSYRQRLNGNWGIVDVNDCCNGAKWLANQGLVDETRMAISGGSSGGFTVLSALHNSELFKVGTSYYGMSDLEALAKKMHKFESRYLDHLIGDYLEFDDLYIGRSPFRFAREIKKPVLLLHGDSDPIVPPVQTKQLYEILRDQGTPVGLIIFEDEGHGFSKAKNIQRAIEAELIFYSKVFGLELDNSIRPLLIENLDQPQ
jgi:dipeptidyl aminopeptidase/acylaminoacyl peptidase